MAAVVGRWSSLPCQSLRVSLPLWSHGMAILPLSISHSCRTNCTGDSMPPATEWAVAAARSESRKARRSFRLERWRFGCFHSRLR